MCACLYIRQHVDVNISTSTLLLYRKAIICINMHAFLIRIYMEFY